MSDFERVGELAEALARNADCWPATGRDVRPRSDKIRSPEDDDLVHCVLVASSHGGTGGEIVTAGATRRDSLDAMERSQKYKPSHFDVDPQGRGERERGEENEIGVGGKRNSCSFSPYGLAAASQDY